MHTKLSIRKGLRVYQRRNKVKIQKVRTQHCLCLKKENNHSRFYSSKLFFAAMEQNSCPLSPDEIPK